MLSDGDKILRNGQASAEIRNVQHHPNGYYEFDFVGHPPLRSDDPFIDIQTANGVVKFRKHRSHIDFGVGRPTQGWMMGKV